MFSACSKSLTWSAVKYLRSRIIFHQTCRCLFSRTGEWDKVYTQDIRQELESHWQPLLHRQHAESGRESHGDREKYYVLSMFPYPSGKLHMGHVRVYTISDAMARFMRMNGKQVIHPMGWDAFGLPAENAAIERGEKPDIWTFSNIKSMRKQLDQLGCSFDWDRECMTCDPEYYRWTQYIFLKMYEVGFVFQKEAEVNWDPVDQTVLADEQISEEGLSWRSGAKVEKKYLKQWYIRTTAYAKSLLDGLEEVNPDLWQDIIKLQHHWIGECTGCRFHFHVKLEDEDLNEDLAVHTESPESVFGVSHICLKKSHRYFHVYKENFVEASDDSVILSRLKAVHPLTGKTLPIVLTDSAQYDEYNDSYLAVPSRSESDREMAEALGLDWEDVTDDTQKTLINSEQFSGLEIEVAREAIMKYARELGVGGHPVSSHLRDWLVSRQRYWGTPIPIIHCPTCKSVPVPFSDLPVILPEVKQLTGRGSSPLALDTEWKSVKCPRCGGAAEREVDTIDTFVDSSWYFLRYLDSQNRDELCRRDLAHKYMPVDLYIGGKEHAVLHMYFARFFNHFLYDLDLVPQKEPFDNLLTQGMVMGQAYRVKGTGHYLPAEKVHRQNGRMVEVGTGQPVVEEWEKMSKSKHNGVDPQDVMEEFGVDTTRLCILGGVSPQSHRKWSKEIFKGIIHWQSRIWSLVHDLLESTKGDNSHPLQGDNSHPPQEKMRRLDAFLFEKRNSLLKDKSPPELMSHSVQFERTLCDLVIMIAPIAPHFASELWTGLASRTQKLSEHYQWDKSILEQSWPQLDEDSSLELVLKMNDQESTRITLPKHKLESLTLEEAHDLVKDTPEYKQYYENREFTDIELRMEYCQAVLNFSLTIPESVVGVKKERKSKEEKKKLKKEHRDKKRKMMKEMSNF